MPPNNYKPDDFFIDIGSPKRIVKKNDQMYQLECYLYF